MTGTVLTGETRVAGVIGWPVAHSLSPRVHGYWLQHYGIDGAYVPLPVKPENVASALAGLPKLGLVGANVTVPHKEAALASAHEATAFAKYIGAANTLVVRTDGTVLADNTDARGFIENLKAGYPAWNAKAGPAVVLGAGGAARAVCAGLLECGVEQLVLCNRSRDRAETLAEVFGAAIRVVPWDDRGNAILDAALVVNTTTLGMAGQPNLEIKLDGLPLSAVVTDLVYRPLKTDLLVAAAARGNPVVDGLGMLLHQARPGFAAWFGVDPEVTDALREFVLAGMP